jgi:mycothiol synthase
VDYRLEGGLSDKEPYVQLQMVWPQNRLETPPVVRVPPGYRLRTHRAGDEARFYEVMALAGFTGWNEEVLRPWRERILDQGWFVVVHVESGQIVATAMALQGYSAEYPLGGQVGWVAGDPAHAGLGLGLAVCAAVTVRLIDAGYTQIYLGTEDWRLAALKTYLKLGYVPVLHTPEMPERWQAVCAQVGWPFTPEVWPSMLGTQA